MCLTVKNSELTLLLSTCLSKLEVEELEHACDGREGEAHSPKEQLHAIALESQISFVLICSFKSYILLPYLVFSTDSNVKMVGIFFSNTICTRLKKKKERNLIRITV